MNKRIILKTVLVCLGIFLILTSAGIYFFSSMYELDTDKKYHVIVAATDISVGSVITDEIVDYKIIKESGYNAQMLQSMEHDVADAVDIVIQINLDRLSGVRYVSRISEIIAGEQDMSFSVRDLFVYDKENKKYLVNKDGPSSSLIRSCLEYEMTASEAAAILDMFSIKTDEKKVFEYMQEGG